MPRRGPEAGSLHKITGCNDFHGLSENIPVHAPFQQKLVSHFPVMPAANASTVDTNAPLSTSRSRVTADETNRIPFFSSRFLTPVMVPSDPLPRHLRDHVEGLPFAAAHPGKVLVHVGRDLARPYGCRDDQPVNSCKIGCARLDRRFYKKRVFNNAPVMPDSLRGTICTSSASSRRAMVAATLSVCPFRENQAIRIFIGYLSARQSLLRDVSCPFHEHLGTDRCETA